MPHVHINYKKEKHKASYSIKDRRRLAGDLDNKYDKVVKEWIAENETRLLLIWNEVQAGNQNQYELLIEQL
jgi:Domain of unknown function (DUF4160)